MFSYVDGGVGGGAFCCGCLFCVIIVGLPIMVSELVIGRNSQKDPVGAYKVIKPNSHWYLVGGIGVLSGFLILSFYGVVAGWTIGYIVESVRGVFFGLHGADQIRNHFAEFAADPVKSVGYHALFIGLCMMIVIKGVKGGIERWSRILMPTLLLILVLLIVRALTLDGAMAGLEFFLKPDCRKMGPEPILIALGHAVFTLSLGMGAMITYGSYLGGEESLPRSAFVVSLLDPVVALMAGLAIFPAVFAMGQQPDVGPGLVFVSLPAVFVEMPGGAIFGPLFFFLLAIAALTSGISLLEVVTAYFVDEKGYSRSRAVLTFGTMIFLIGIPSALSMGAMRDFVIIRWNPFDFVDHIASNYLLPVGGLLISIFVGWAWGVRSATEEARKGNPSFPWARMWHFLIKYICPFIVGQIILFEGLLTEFRGEEIENTIGRIRDGAGILDIILLSTLVLLGLYDRYFRGSDPQSG